MPGVVTLSLSLRQKPFPKSSIIKSETARAEEKIKKLLRNGVPDDSSFKLIRKTFCKHLEFPTDTRIVTCLCAAVDVAMLQLQN